MYINRFFSICMTLGLVACGGHNKTWTDQYGKYDPTMVTEPSAALYGTYTAERMSNKTHKIAAILPLSGKNASVGKIIRTSVETAALQSAPDNLNIKFYDSTSSESMQTAIMDEPEVIIGPVFAGNVRLLHEIKSPDTPVLSFTSDATAIGDGVMTMALMPANSVEAIVKEMQTDRVDNFIILAPDTESGRLMAGVAKKLAADKNMVLSGIFYYKENNSESIKNATFNATINEARTAANTRALEILSDILTKEDLSVAEKLSLTDQLDKLSKSDTLGKLPFNAILFLGNASDTKSLASFLRYYGINTHDANFYGTAMWDGTDISSDITMSGAKYAALPEISAWFTEQYQLISGDTPNHLSAFGYDATNMAIGMLYSEKNNAEYLLNPSGYLTSAGLVRLRPNGDNERGLRIMELNGTGMPRVVRNAAKNFIQPMYTIDSRHITPALSMPLQTTGINPLDYIRIPDRFKAIYKSKTFGTNVKSTVSKTQIQENIVVLPEDDSDTIVSPDFQSVMAEKVNKTYIDSVEISE